MESNEKEPLLSNSSSKRVVINVPDSITKPEIVKVETSKPLPQEPVAAGYQVESTLCYLSHSSPLFVLVSFFQVFGHFFEM